ncbi:MAG: hypothetical protein K9G36_08065 [Crocinitomicaceae bacterium]|nr:hypothetical protein [Crocinitomicaceae bacterium]MCF8445105.1 hypothetical protein [Crocinitomicaceae bacterium]
MKFITPLIRSKNNLLVFSFLISINFNLFCQSGEQNIALKEIITKTISNIEDEFKNQDVIYFEIPPFLKTTSTNETYNFEKQKNYTICILNAYSGGNCATHSGDTVPLIPVI